MVGTRRTSEIASFPSDVGGRRETKGKKSAEIREENTSDESGLNTKLISSKRRRLHSKEAIVIDINAKAKGKAKRDDQTPEPERSYFSPPKTRLRSGRLRVERIEASSSTPQKRGRTVGKAGRRSRRYRESVEQVINRSETDTVPSIRRSCRRRRGVYDTLNVQMLTDHRFVHAFEAFSGKKSKKRRNRRVLEDQTDSGSDEDLEAVNMYDIVKRKHESPSPEKGSGGHRGRHGDDDDGDDDDDDDDDDEEGDDESDDENDEDGEDEEEHRKKYLLRKKKPVINRYTAPPIKNPREKKAFRLALRRERLCHDPPPHASPIRRFRQHKRKAINMSSSTSSSDNSCDEKDERRFERRKSKSMAKARNRALPINLTIEDISKGILQDRERIGSSLADVDPMSVDRQVLFDSIGGLGKQIRALKEMILFPLMYPEVFEKFKITPPRGVLFFGPPGTGKTLVARALANECSQGDKKVSFFMRKGADCLSKWVGESERQLRLLFDQAYAMRPSIIFFDEIDGLAPVRSSRQDQIHSSIVSTLLALMDGLDSRGEVVVIGATNRIDAIDPALRRPGRFDREFQFPLPDRNARRSILSIHTREWEPKLSQTFVNELADYCVGYCGADIKALCTEAAIFALRRQYPQVYSSSKKLLLDVDSIEVTYKDFFRATKSIVPAFQRSVTSPARVLSVLIKHLLENTFSQAVELVTKLFPQAQSKLAVEHTPCSLMGNTGNQRMRTSEIPSDDDLSSDGEDAPNIYDNTNLSSSSRSERYMRRMKRHEMPDELHVQTKSFSFSEELFKGPVTYRPRLLLAGREGMGHSTHLAPALLHSMEHLSVHCLDLPALYGVTSRTPEEACSQLFREARRSSPCVIYMPHINSLWFATGDSLHATLMSLFQDLPPLAPVLLLATADREFDQLPSEIKQLFSKETGQVLQVCCPNAEERRAFFHRVFMEYAIQPPKPKKTRRDKIQELLPFASSPPRQLSEIELKKIHLNEENTMRELRIFLRDVNQKLITDRRFKEFSKPVDLEEVNDYLEVIEEPMDLAAMMQKIDRHQYNTCAHYLLDVDLITSNALKYNPDRDPLDKIIRHRACELRDVAHSLIKSQLEPEFEKACEEIITSRERRGETSSAGAPAYVFTVPRKRPSTQPTPEEQHTVDQSNTEGQVPEASVTCVSTASSSAQGGRDVPSKSYRKKGRPCGRRRHVRRRHIKSELKESGKQDDEAENNEECIKHDDLVENDIASAHDTSMESCDAQNDDKDATKNEHLGNIGDIEITESEEEDKDEHQQDQNRMLNPDRSLCSSTKAKDCESRNSELRTISQHDMVVSSGIIQNGDANVSSDYETEEEKVSSGGAWQKSEQENANTCKKYVHFGSGASLPNGLSVRKESCERHSNDEEESDGKGRKIEGKEEEDIEEIECQSSKRTTGGYKDESNWKGKLEQLLKWLVDITEGSTVEVLERYHSALQLCIHQHRYNSDKAQLLEVLENTITGWTLPSSATVR